jgi:8-oxo-dGTP diphosphatase/2-hydroxy-dATP diphosphatase
MRKRILTLCIIHKDSKILLGMKKRGFGAGFWNGFGGKVKEGESIEEAAKRETKEEIGVVPLDLKKMGILRFQFKGEAEILEVHVFRCSDFEGEIKETEEMKPRWFKIEEIPFDQMWPDDKYWLPLLLEGKNFRGKFYFESRKLVDYQIETT